MKHLIFVTIFTILLMLPSRIIYSQQLVQDTGTQLALHKTNAALVKLNTVLSKLNITEKEESIERTKRLMEKAEKVVRTSKQFAKHGSEIQRTADVLSSMYCMFDEIATLREQRRGLFNFHSCYANLQQDIYTIRLRSQITTLTQLFEEALDISAMAKLDTWREINKDLADLSVEMQEEITDLKAEIYKEKQLEQQAENNRNQIIQKSRFYFSTAKNQSNQLPLLD